MRFPATSWLTSVEWIRSGPLAPRAFAPWQKAQFCRKSALPSPQSAPAASRSAQVSLSTGVGLPVAFFGDLAQEQRLLPAVALFDRFAVRAGEGPGVINAGGEQLGREDGSAVAEAGGPELPEMPDVFRFRLGRTDRHLHAPGIADPAVEEADAFEHRLEKRELVFEAAVDHFLAGVPVGEIAVEAQIGKLPNELDGAPHVLEEGRAMGFDVQRKAVSC